ncbi:protein NO VEIN domain-containing protein [Arthrobacter sp. HLT1-21]
MTVRAVRKKARWWDDDASQRYWMEVVYEERFGSQLIAPGASRHDRMNDVQVGDIVIHWLSRKNPMRWKPGVYGASVVAGALQNGRGDWLGQAADVIPLSNYTALKNPLLLTELRAHHQEDVLGVLRNLTEKFSSPKQTIYFPFNRHPRAGLKPNEGYLFKMPEQVVRLVPSMLPDSDWGGFDTPLVSPPISGQNGVRQRYAGFCADPILKKAIEMQAVRQAIAHYEADGYCVEDVGAYRSYDLLATRRDEERHVEVKGSQGYVEKVILTRNEVTHANDYGLTDLVVVAEISWERHLDGSITTDEGTMSVYPDWRPSPENLNPLSYEYFLD